MTLAPCPRCGGPARPMVYGGGVLVGCASEHCPYLDDAWASTDDKAAAAWNRQVEVEAARRARASQ